MHTPLFYYTQYLLIAEVVAVISGFCTWQKWKNNYFKWFPVYLFIITALEIGNNYFGYLNQHTIAAVIKEIEVPFEILFINWFFYKTLAANKRKIIIAGAFVYMLSWILEQTVFKESDYYFESLSYTVGNLFILIYLILFFIELVSSDKILAFKKLTVFWIVLGMLVFYLGTFPFYGLYNELAKNMDVFIPVAWVATSLNYFMYLLFTFGLLWGKAD